MTFGFHDYYIFVHVGFLTDCSGRQIYIYNVSLQRDSTWPISVVIFIVFRL